MRLVFETRVSATPEEVFAWHEQRGVIQRLFPPWERVELLEGGDSLRVGSRVAFRVKVGPFWVRWIAEHIEYDPPHRFADRQVAGPFAFWCHTHEFLDLGDGTSLLRDEVTYELPFGWLGRALGSKYVARKLKQMFDFRHAITRRELELPP